MYFFGYDTTWLILLPGILLALFAQSRINSAFNRYSQVPGRHGWRAADIARRMLNENGLNDVQIGGVAGSLTDHYDPRRQRLNLSEPVLGSTSLAALGIAAHEVGHAVQHREHYGPMRLRSALVPLANFGSTAAWPLLLLGLILSIPQLIWIGVAVFAFAVLFQLITLPVEFKASRRALAMLQDGGYLVEEELVGARKVLQAAALTYLAATLTSMLQLLRLMMLASGRRNRR